LITAFPGQPVKLLGLRTVPSTGSELISVETETLAKTITDRRERLAELKALRELAATKPISEANSGNILKDVTTAADIEIEATKVPILGVVLKADSLGAVEALRRVAKDVAGCTSQVDVRVIDASVGVVTVSDVERLTSLGDSLVLGFNVKIADNTTKATAKQVDVPIELDNVIYRLEEVLVEHIEKLLPKDRMVTKQGTGKVLKAFKVRMGSKLSVAAGCTVQTGKFHGPTNGFQYFYKVIRNGEIILDQSSYEIDLKRFKDSVKEVDVGSECGLTLEGFTDFQEQDEIECYRVEMQVKSLSQTGYVPSRLLSQHADTPTDATWNEKAKKSKGKKK
jgi:translation initiation factor IF-2